MKNRLQHETSPYLLQHADNPVEWYPWGEAAFQRAKEEDKPVFLSIGYSTCHWCHVMAHESFEDQEIADLLNRHFISIKVDKEERPDVDSVYMTVCQAFTGSGGWPTSIFMTPEQKPFFAGTYYPKYTRGGMIGLRELLGKIAQMWKTDRETLLQQADDIVAVLTQPETTRDVNGTVLLHTAVAGYRRTYDRKYGGFGSAPKFPTAHNLLFLLACGRQYSDDSCMEMVEHTLLQMHRGGMYDHIGGGFCRYSTDARFLVPHFEKMLYDNALLILAYCQAYTQTQKPLYCRVAQQTADYILREMTAPEGGFYSAQDADSDGEEGKYYIFTPSEIEEVLWKENGKDFCRHYDITEKGNFEGKSIPNLLDSDPEDRRFDPLLPQLQEYRRQRCRLHTDDKILTSWNGLMIAAMCSLYRISGQRQYLDAARAADRFIWESLQEGGKLYVSFRAGKRGQPGFLDDYAACCFAQLALHQATLEEDYLQRAQQLCRTVMEFFGDTADGGFFLYGTGQDSLILRPKETYDGAMPSGNGLMAWNLVRLWNLTSAPEYRDAAERQLAFLASDAARYPMGHAMFLLAQLEFDTPPVKITLVTERPDEQSLPLQAPLDAMLLLRQPTREMPLKNEADTFYVCRGHTCLPPVNDVRQVL